MSKSSVVFISTHGAAVRKNDMVMLESSSDLTKKKNQKIASSSLHRPSQSGMFPQHRTRALVVTVLGAYLDKCA